jgi:SOS response regulatory protein OraA/RecX
MRERNREINRRRQRYEKRKRLRQKLAAAGDADRQAIEAKIRKTYPRYVQES